MIEVLSSGFMTTVQDLGRTGYANSGVPVSGVMDNYSAKLGNAILDNNENDAVIEITFGSCKFKFQNSTCICVSGADFSAQINNKLIVLNTSIKVFKNDILSFGNQQFGVRTYVSILGGFQTQTVLNSKSFYNGITANSIIKKGDLIPFNIFNTTSKTTFSSIKTNQNHFNSKTLACFKGPEFHLLSQLQQDKLLETVFSISNKNNRMAYQLNELIENDLSDMLTSSILPGTVQLTPSGKLIVLMRDCQVTGGYPRVLQLSESSINILSQKATRDIVKFKIVD